MIKLKTWGWFPLALGLVASSAWGEQQAKAPDPSSTQPAATISKAKAQKTLTLNDVTRVDTSESARRAAANMTDAQAKASKAKKDGRTPVAEPAVVEFQPAGSDASAAGKPVVVPDSKGGKAPLKNVHGSVYGALGASGHEDAASVGASSKGGKTSVYVETDHTSATSPASH